MFDIGWSELLVIGVVALIAIGPKELPGVLRTVGQWVGKIRRMAAEFQGQFQEAIREAEMDDLKKEVDAITAGARDIADSVHSATRIDDPFTPSSPVAASEPIPAGPPPLVSEPQADGAVPLGPPAEQQALPPPVALPVAADPHASSAPVSSAPASSAPVPHPPASSPPASDLPAQNLPAPNPPAAAMAEVHIPLPPPAPPVNAQDFAAPAPVQPRKAGEGAA